MKAQRSNLKQNLLIVVGFLLLIAGVSGVLWGQLRPSKPSNYGMYIGPMKQATSMQISITPEPTSPPNGSEVTPTPTIEATPGLLDRIAPRNYSVHAGTNNPIESPAIPDRIVVPSIGLDAPVVASDFNFMKLEGETFGQWQAPSMYAAGWHPNSALLGKRGNTVINGHHNEYGEVFGKLVDLQVGDFVYVYSRGEKFAFVIANRMILPERFQPVNVRLENARWINPTDDVRLTLITCWPKESNTHRLILVGRPVAVN